MFSSVAIMVCRARPAQPSPKKCQEALASEGDARSDSIDCHVASTFGGTVRKDTRSEETSKSSTPGRLDRSQARVRSDRYSAARGRLKWPIARRAPRTSNTDR